MKVSKKGLQKIIKEEITRILSEFNGPPGRRATPVRRPAAGAPVAAPAQTVPAAEKPEKGKLAAKRIKQTRAIAASGKISTGEAAALDALDTQYVQAAEIHGTLEKDPAVKRYMALLVGAIEKIIGASKKEE